VPGRAAPRIITRAAVERMKAGSVIVDIAAEQGGNCELTRPGERGPARRRQDRGSPPCPARCRITQRDVLRNLFNLLKPALVAR
jgi:NAD(P) transhydrogenase subunit alpha